MITAEPILPCARRVCKTSYRGPAFSLSRALCAVHIVPAVWTATTRRDDPFLRAPLAVQADLFFGRVLSAEVGDAQGDDFLDPQRPIASFRATGGQERVVDGVPSRSVPRNIESDDPRMRPRSPPPWRARWAYVHEAATPVIAGERDLLAAQVCELHDAALESSRLVLIRFTFQFLRAPYSHHLLQQLDRPLEDRSH